MTAETALAGALTLIGLRHTAANLDDLVATDPVIHAEANAIIQAARNGVTVPSAAARTS